MTDLLLIRLEIDLRLAKLRLQAARDEDSKIKWGKIHASIEQCVNDIRMVCEGC